jgi:serralysin
MPTPTGYSYTTFTMLTGNKALDSLLADDYWTGTLFHQSGTPTLLTYSFITTNSYFARDYSPNNEYLNGFTLSSAQENAVNSALSMWSSVANIQFSLVSETISNVGDLRFGGYLGMDQKYAAWAYFPDRTPVAGDVWIGPQTDDPSPVKGSYDYLTFVHEIGHALGLKHPFEASDGNRTILSPSLDDVRFTVMSYNDSYSYQPTTPMLLDILAIQKLYGANTQWQSGNNFYNWAPDQSVFETIWDTGGVDAIDGSNQLQAVRIDLNEGAFSQIGKAFLQTDTLTSFNEGLAIAYGSQIENAYGSAFNDTLIGNNLSNLLDGMAGADTMSGGSGNDIYVVDNVGDVVIETSAFSGEIDSVYSSISYTLTNNVENLTLQGSANLNGTGNFVNNQIYGNAGNNVLDGGLGADILVGGAGNDTYIVDDARDVIFETNAQASEVDTVLASVSYVLSANVENITLTGFSSNFAVGNSQNNVLTGNEGNNVLDGGAGLDTMIGGQGNDTYSLDQFGELALVQELADEGSDTLSVTFNATAQTGTIDLNQSNLNSMENITLLGAGVFSLLGNGLDNTLIGNADSNILDGGSGADTLIGGAGNDVYVVDNASDIVLETSTVSSEIDSVYSTISYTLGANVEYLTLQGNANINGTGNALANLINGNAGDNVLDGGAGGGDVLVGGAGNDTYIVDSLNDAIFETSTVVSEIDTVQSSVDWTLGANLENLVLTGTASIAGTGNELNNLIIGNAGNNILDGGAGADTLNGGAGNDIYVVDNVGDVVTETGTSAAEIDYVYASINYALTNNVEVLTLQGSANLNGTGNTLDNQIYGNSGNNILDGGAGADTLLGGTGNDTYIVDNVGDAAVETSTVPSEIDTVLASVSYTLGANVEYLTLQGNANINGTGNALANLINGNAGDNVLDGGAGGGDVLVGGAGNDTYIIDSLNDAIFETSTVVSEIDTVQSSVDWTLGANLENLVLTGTASIAGTGNALDNLITGNAGNNILDGGAGADTLNGGAGNDIYVVDNIGDVVTETGTSAAEIDYVYASINYALTNNVEVLTLQGSADLNGSGNALNNQIYGNSGNNILDGGTGLDTLAGGTGNDTYRVDDAGDVVVETSTLASEIDTVLASVSYVLSANVENITLTGSNSNFAVGNSQNNVLTGNDGNNVLDGGAGLDTMIGGKGNDTYSLDQFGELTLVQELADEGSDTLSVTFNATAQTGTIDLNQSNLNNMENIALLGAGVFSLLGNGLDNTLIGNADSNILDGGSGADTLIGGAGGDIYVVDNVGDMIVETSTLASEIDSVYSTISYTLGANVEYLTLQGNANINGTGNALANLINGNAGDNVLDGGAGGGDVLVGGAGNDTYIVDSLNDAIFETSTVVSEIDTVQSSVDWTLGANLENLVLTGTASIAGTGNALDNLITGNAGNNILDGGAGADTLNGGAGNDIYVVDNIGDVVTETGTSAAEIDYVYASVDYTLTNNVEVLILQGGADLKGTGNALNNQIFGNSGNNIIDGGAGADTLTGGAGADTFVFAAVSEMGIGSNRDVITDFNSLQGDKIDLSQFDASLLSAGFNAFTFIGAGDFTSAGQLRFVDHVLSGNVSGDTGADFEIQLVGVNNFSASDLVA